MTIGSAEGTGKCDVFVDCEFAMNGQRCPHKDLCHHGTIRHEDFETMKQTECTWEDCPCGLHCGCGSGCKRGTRHRSHANWINFAKHLKSHPRYARGVCLWQDCGCIKDSKDGLCNCGKACKNGTIRKTNEQLRQDEETYAKRPMTLSHIEEPYEAERENYFVESF